MGDNLILILPFIFGAVVGSFLNVCIHRIPLGLSIVSPPSRCPGCESPIRFYDNVPVISYILLGGRCRRCKTPISIEYPSVELLTGVFAALLFYKFGLSPELFVYSVFIAALITITFIDLKHQIIPDVISIPGIPLGFAASFFMQSPGVLDSAIGIVSGGGILLGIAAAYLLVTGNEGMGGGDIKLLAMIGAFTGWKGVIFTLLAASFSGAIIGGAVMMISGKNSRVPIPFGPFLAAGAALYLFFGEFIISWYIQKAIGA